MPKVFQEGIEITSNVVGFTSFPDLERMGVHLERPPYVCYLSHDSMFTVLSTNKGLRIATCDCLECANTWQLPKYNNMRRSPMADKTHECPICALSLVLRERLKPIFIKLINQQLPKGQGLIHTFIGLLNLQLEEPLVLPKLSLQFNSFTDPSLIEMEMETLPNIQLD